MSPAIIRQAPGEKTHWSGTYALVGHYGDPKGFSVKLAKGERLPLAAADADGPLWYVLVDISTEDVQAA